MGTLTLPSSGHIYLDTSAIIYSVERIEPYFTLLAPQKRLGGRSIWNFARPIEIRSGAALVGGGCFV